MRADPIGQPMIDRPNLQIDSLDAAKRLRLTRACREIAGVGVMRAETKECGMTQRPPQAALRVPFVACALARSERRT